MESSQPSPEEFDQSVREDARVLRRLQPAIYEQLKAVARKQMAHQRAGHTLQPTALVHEAWAKLAAVKGLDVESRGSFLALAATAMRTILIDHARGAQAQKRGAGNVRVDLSVSGHGVSEEGTFVLHLHESLERLAALDETLGRVAELRCFGGLSHQEIAEATGSSLRSVERTWRAARAWLQRELEDS